MYNVLIVLIILAAILLTILVLVQNSKGGGLAAGFQSSNQIMGVRKTTDFLEKATWGLMIAIVVLSVISTGISKGKTINDPNQSEISQEALDLNVPTTAPIATPDFGEAMEDTAEE